MIAIVGLDGATWDLARPLMDAGKMPTLAALERRGVCATLLSTYPPISAPAWVTFLTCITSALSAFAFARSTPE